MHRLRVWRWKVHWQIALAIALGIAAGTAVQLLLDPGASIGVTVDATGRVVEVGARTEPAEEEEGGEGATRLRVGDVIVRVAGEPTVGPEALARRLAAWPDGSRVRVTVSRGGEEVGIWATVRWASGSPRSMALSPFDFAAEMFRRLLQMLIVPLILTSLVTGVTSLGDVRTLGRMGAKTLGYYVLSSLLAILVGLLLVNWIQPGVGAPLDLAESVDSSRFSSDEGLAGVFLRMVPTNVYASLTENGRILQVIFFSLLVGVFIAQGRGEGDALLRRLFEAGFEVMMRIAKFVLLFVPVGVFALIARVVGASGFEVFRPLLLLMLTVILALVVHACVTLPLLLRLLAGIRPLAWARAVMPALVTAFSTSSSAITLPETMRSVEERGKVSNRSASFVLPLGATINMDGTALYECVGVIFLAQYYGSTTGFELTASAQVIVVITSLLASIGAAGIPSAGLVMMTTILSALELPLEGVVLLLAIDRPLDMLRTAVNVWSDTTCTAVIARSEGETDISGSGPIQYRSGRVVKKR